MFFVVPIEIDVDDQTEVGFLPRVSDLPKATSSVRPSQASSEASHVALRSLESA